jgi:PAS domain S-box-containing protein
VTGLEVDLLMITLDPEILNLIIESLPTGTVIVDPEGKIVRLNQPVEAWFGYRREELLGQSVELLVPEKFRAIHPSQRADYLKSPHVRPMGANRDLFARHKDGTQIPCDVSLHPLPLREGMHVLVHIVDATPRKALEARQRHEESLRRMQFMVENLPAGAVYVSLDNQTLLVNRAFEKMTGYTAEELTNLDQAFQLLFRERAIEVRQLHDEDQLAGFPTPRELELERKDGHKAWVEVASYRYNNHEVWLWHDITDRLAAQERLVQSARLAAIGQMMTGLAHESRNALQRARASLEMMGLDLGDNPQLRSLSQRAVSAVDELQRLYEEVRGYAAPIQLERREVDLEEAWREAWGQIQAVHTEKRVTLISHCEESARRAMIDRYRVGQVFRNILENAVAVLPEQGGTIDVSARLVKEFGSQAILIEIADNGPGMNAEQRARIFEPFFTTKTRGTGLGMAIVRRIMESHGGTATVGAPERGAKIILRFPTEPQ